MKTERRHELQTNTLAITLARWIEVLKPYSRAGLALVIALTVVVFAWGYLSAQGSRRLAEGWNEYFEATMSRDPLGRLNEIAEQYAGTTVGEWSRLSWADIQLDQGTTRLFVEKKDARDELRQAAEKYQAILIESRDPTLLQRATFGLARAHEAQGALEKAREQYRKIAKQWPNSPYAAAAEARANDLEQPATKSFYDWFASYEPPRPLAREPGTPGARPDFMGDPSENGGLKLPASSDDKAPPLKIITEPAGGQPAEPADDKPAEPGDGQPAEPSAEKPAEPSAADGGADGTQAAPQPK